MTTDISTLSAGQTVKLRRKSGVETGTLLGFSRTVAYVEIEGTITRVPMVALGA